MPRPWPVHDADTGTLVGFAMISVNIPQPMDDDLIGPYYRGSCSSTTGSSAAARERGHGVIAVAGDADAGGLAAPRVVRCRASQLRG
jgi:hypothetical protein